MNKNSFETSNPNCIKARLCCDKIQYGEGKFWMKLRLMLHLAHCKHCRNYSACNYKLTELMGKANLEVLQPDERKSLKRQLEQKLG